jgi:CRISPR/Cas system-associated exonuclease Cas4 (RecB family)
MTPTLLESPSAAARRDRARGWLLAQPPGTEVLVVGGSSEAVDQLLREAARERGAAFGWHRATIVKLARTLAEEPLAALAAVPVGRLVAQAVVTRVVHEAQAQGKLGRFADAAEGPGLVRALGAALEDLRMAGAPAEVVAEVVPEMAELASAYDAALAEVELADRAQVMALAHERAQAGPHPWLGLPTLWLDVPLATERERSLAAAVTAAAPDVLATVPTGDAASLAGFEAMLGVSAERLDVEDPERSLARLQQHLFEETRPPEAARDAGLALLSAPGESRECVEIARRIQQLGASVPFDRIAILLRTPELYRTHLAEALRRANVPAHFARGAILPDPTGRAFMALLACAAEDLSARRFAEYLSLGEVPEATPDGAPPAAAPPDARWVAPDEEMLSPALAEALQPEEPEPEQPSATAPVSLGRLRAPRQWERLLVDASVIGGRDRWAARLEGLSHELRLDLDALEDPDDPLAERLERDLGDLTALRDYALPLLEALAALPKEAAWGVWMDALAGLATRALRRPERVLSVLSELAPMAAVGPVDLEEVQLVLARRLLELAKRPKSARYGKVFVAPIDAVRGLDFDVVFVPGLAEKLFPKKLDEDPVLLDAARRHVGGLATRDDRLRQERLALRLAVGAAKQQVVLSYPRLDVDQGRPRVPSFYGLEALRAAEGRLPGFDELASDAERVASARVGWPAPRDPADAIDEAEHDLALLHRLLESDVEKSQGAARFLLEANPHLGRALRFRARRWLNNWTVADGLVKPGEEGHAAIAAHGLDARSFSPTALQNYAACPYKFFLYAVHRLAPREAPEAIEELDPLQRGSMVHDVQFRLFEQLRDADLLPVSEADLDVVRGRLDAVLDEVAGEYRDELAPAIDRVWKDGVDSVRADLREWLERGSRDPSGFVPWRFELSFGLKGRRDRDPHSQDEPVALDCGIQLRGSIDLVERHDDGRLRVTDHKTGKLRFKEGEIVAGGLALQPVLYALAIEKLFPDQTVDSGRLYYCTSAGNFSDRSVPLDAVARNSAQRVADAIGQALAEPFLPAAPDEGACRWCDYKNVCGPYEEVRVLRKPKAALEPLLEVRKLS